MVFVIGLALIVVGVFLLYLLGNERGNQQKEDFLLIGFQFRIMIYMLIGSGIIVILRKLILLFFWESPVSGLFYWAAGRFFWKKSWNLVRVSMESMMRYTASLSSSSSWAMMYFFVGGFVLDPDLLWCGIFQVHEFIECKAKEPGQLVGHFDGNIPFPFFPS